MSRRTDTLNNKPLWDNELVQFPRLLAEIFALLEPPDFVKGGHNYKLHLQLHALQESMDLTAKQIRQLFERAMKRWEGIKERECPGEPCECDEDSLWPGILFPCQAGDSDFASVERCDMCSRYAWDDEAAAEMNKLLLNKGYSVASYLLPGWRWESAGSTHFVLMKVVEQSDGSHVLIPQTLDEAVALVKRLEKEQGMDDEALCCPKCGGTELDVQLPAVFRWDGEAGALGPSDLNSCEFPVEDNAVVVCGAHVDEKSCGLCDWTGKVKDLVPKKS